MLSAKGISANCALTVRNLEQFVYSQSFLRKWIVNENAKKRNFSTIILM
jgi:hypothetical protein